ncbi:MAG: right-handed parallel beta-helix repeat-containing protein, partial [Candidatus Pacearchaeota archaeon]
INVSEINYTYSDDNPGYCWYSNNSGIWNSSSVPAGENFTDVISEEGWNNFTVYCNDSLGNIGNSSVSFFKDSINPIINITYPENISYNINVSEINYTYSDDNPGYCWYSNNSGIWNSSSVPAGENFTNVISEEGWNNFTLYCNDSAGNLNFSSVSFFKDSVAPIVDLIFPENNTNIINGTQYFAGNFSDLTGGLLNSTLYIWNSSGNLINFTNISISGTNNLSNISVKLPRLDTYYWNYYVCDNLSNCAWNSTNFTLVYSNVFNISSCQILDVPNVTYVLINNVTSNTTCFNITATNVTIDCQGYEINYSANGTAIYGIYSDKNYTTIKNCNIREGKPGSSYSIYGIYTINSGYFTLYNNNISFYLYFRSGCDIGIYIGSNIGSNNISNNNFDSGISKGYADAIAVSGSNNYIYDNNITGNFSYGFCAGGLIRLSGNNNSIYRNFVNLTSYGNRILILTGSNNSILNNSFIADSGNYPGILLSSSSNNTIIGNNVTVVYGEGYSISGTSFSHFNQNFGDNNFVDGFPLNYLKNINNLIFENLTGNEYGQIIILNSSNLTIKNSNITKDGLSLFFINNSIIKNNNISGVGVRINLYNSSNINFTDNYVYSSSNTVFNCVWGRNISVLNNSITASSGFYYRYLISFSNCFNNTVAGNYLNSTGGNYINGIRLESNSNNNNFTNNNVSVYGDVSSAFPISSSNNNYISSSILIDNGNYHATLNLYGSSNNTIYNVNIKSLGAQSGVSISNNAYNNILKNIFINSNTKTNSFAGILISSNKVNSTFIDSVINVSNKTDIYAGSDLTTDSYLKLVNVTFNKSDTLILDSDFLLINQYYLDVNVSNSTSQLDNSIVNVSNSSGLISSLTTPASGIVRFNLTEYIERNLSGTQEKIYADNYILNVSRVGYYDYENSTINMSDNLLVNVNLNLKIYPQFSNYWDNNGSIFSFGLAMFNVTVANTNGTVILNINNTNFTASNLSGNIFNVSVEGLSNGTYSYYWISFGNDSNENLNISEIRSYTVNVTPKIGLSIIYPKEDVEVTFGTFFNVTLNVSCLEGDCGEINVSLDPEPVLIPITNCTDLQDMKNDLFGYYYLTNDIDCSDTVNWNNGKGFEPIGNMSSMFNGIFQGDGYKIRNLYIKRDGDNVGLFGYVDEGWIENVGLTDVNISFDGEFGGTAGALVAYNFAGTISNSYSTGIVYGNNFIGGLVGFNKGIINNSYSNANVSGENYYSNYYLGGLVGFNYYEEGVGGDGVISNSYSTGKIICLYECDGIGGLVGYNFEGTISNSFWDKETSGQLTSDGGTGKTTLEMKNISTFSSANWSIALKENYTNEVWFIDNGNDYPRLGFEFENEETTKGLIPYGSGTPFYTNVSNPFNLTLNEGESQLVIFWVNATGEPNTYEFFSYANKTNYLDIGNITEKWNVSIIYGATSYSLELSQSLSEQINWSIISLPIYNQSAYGNNDSGDGISTYYVNISTEGGKVDLYIKANDDLINSGGDRIGIGNETFSYNMTNSSVPSSIKYRLTKNFSDNKIGDGLSNGDSVYFKFFLSAPAGQPAGYYNNTIMFKLVSHGKNP